MIINFRILKLFLLGSFLIFSNITNSTLKPIGIIGGAGPMAGCKLFEKIINICSKKYNCKFQHDFPEVFLVSYPFTTIIDVLSQKNYKYEVQNQLKKCFEVLKNNNIQISCIACNTLHTVLNLDDVTSEFIHIVQTTLSHAKIIGLKKVLILGSQTTLSLNLYSSNFIECISPTLNHQQGVNTIIENILAGKINELDSEKLKNIVRFYVEKNSVDGVVLGCTELPLIFEAFPFELVNNEKKIVVLDTLEILAQELLKRSFGF